jgi:hypothetical protein
MRQNRPLAVWLRTFAGLLALTGLLALGGCGGGSGAPYNVFNAPTSLALFPAVATAYPATPITLTVQGGTGPYTIFSSDPTVLPVDANVVGNTVTVIPNSVSVSKTVTLTLRDKLGATSEAVITVQPSPLVNSLKLKADEYIGGCPNAGGSANPNDDSSSTFICGGQTGSVSIRIANAAGGGIGGRPIRFDIVQGAFQIFTEAPGQTPTFALTSTVPTDQNGNAVVRIRAVPGAAQQIAIVQATDVNTGSFVRGTFVILSVTNANAADLVVVPTTVTITGPDNQTCSSGVSVTYYIFGGQPPYTIRNTAPQFIAISPTVVQSAGGGFTVTTLGGCVDPATIPVTDSAAHTVTVTLSNVVGTTPPAANVQPVPITVLPSPIPTLGCGGTTAIVATGGGTIDTTSGTQTKPSSLFVGTDRPDILDFAPATPSPGQPVTLTRFTTGSVNGGGGTVNVSLFISDGSQTKTVPVTVQNTCP